MDRTNADAIVTARVGAIDKGEGIQEVRATTERGGTRHDSRMNGILLLVEEPGNHFVAKVSGIRAETSDWGNAPVSRVGHDCPEMRRGATGQISQRTSRDRKQETGKRILPKLGSGLGWRIDKSMKEDVSH